ncbi:MAG: hypothetical protein GQ527_04400 [Bacteroidales bacterium]|nr:hypothetical protein [Bacteroidales bacterium]
MKITAKIRKRFNLVFKILLIALVYLFLFFELANHKQNIWGEFTNNTSNIIMKYFWAALLLMPINWLIESVKWQFLIRKIEAVKLKDAYQAVLAGTAISIFTPNRIGDYLGRIFILKKGDRLDGTVATIAGNLSQLLITIIMGSFAIFYFMETININYLHVDSLLVLLLRILLVIINTLLIIVFFKFPLLENRLNKHFEIYKYPIIRHFNLLAEFKTSELLKILLLSTFRFLIYSIQFLLLFKAFQVNLAFGEGLLIVFLIFFGITIVPSIAVAELGIRGLISIFVFNILWNNSSQVETLETAIVSATSLLWLINLAIPALLGGLFIFNLRFIRKTDEINFQKETKEK